jgi:hypothetical protein
LSGSDILASLDRTLRDTAVDTRSDVEAGRIGFTLNQDRLRADEVPKRKTDDRDDNETYDDGGAFRNRRPRRLCVARPRRFDDRGRSRFTGWRELGLRQLIPSPAHARHDF